MDGPTVTYLIMFTVIVISVTCVIYLSNRSDRFEDEADDHFATWLLLHQDYRRLIEAHAKVVARNTLLEELLDAKFTDLFFAPAIHIHQGGTQQTYCGIDLPTTATVVAWEDSDQTTCAKCGSYFTDSPTKVEPQLSLFHETGIGYLEYTD